MPIIRKGKFKANYCADFNEYNVADKEGNDIGKITYEGFSQYAFASENYTANNLLHLSEIVREAMRIIKSNQK